MLERLETRVPPLMWMLVAIGVVWVVSLGGERFVEQRGTFLGLLMITVGVGVAVASVIDFRTEKTTVDPMNLGKTTSLVTTGVYRVTRNPMYLGMLCVVVGAGLWTGSLVATVVGAGVFVALITRLQILPEERALAEMFGKKYHDFMGSVRRWI